MGNNWYVSPVTPETLVGLPGLPTGDMLSLSSAPSIGPTLNQVLAALKYFPECQINVRRRDRKDKGQSVYIELRRNDGSYAVDIHLLQVKADDQPAGVFYFDYYRETDELVRLVSKLAEVCGPLVLWHDSGGEYPVLVQASTPG
jgi:hypothetical protein